jgi:diguanylate cyclase (GGDEF)-like protein/PAS domain S-box-containing protein
MGKASRVLTEPTRILLVEDEAISAMDLRQHLEEFGYRVTGIAASCEQALRLCQRSPPDIVLMDIVLRGECDGIQAATLIREKHDIPVVYLTAYGDADTVRRAREAMPCGFLVKPYRPDEIRATIEVSLFRHRLERKKLRQSERWFANTLHCVSDGVIASDEAGVLRFINPVAEAIVGCRYDEAIGRPVAQVLRLVEESSGRPIDLPVAAVLENRLAVVPQTVAVALGAGNSACVVEYGAAPILDDNGLVLGAVMAIRDIGKRREVERALAESEERFHSAFEFAAIGMAMVAIDGRFLQINGAICAILGKSAADIRNTTLSALCHPDDRDPLDEQLRELVAGGPGAMQIELRFACEDTRTAWALVSVSLVCDGRGTPLYFIVQVQDLTARRSAEQQLVRFAQFDHLTGLYNRGQLLRLLDQAIARAQRQDAILAAIFIDLDNFKVVNDTFGHDSGDTVLRAVAHRLHRSVRDSDIVARLGGDQFLVVLTGIDRVATARMVADKIIVAMQEPVPVAGRSVVITISVGISVYPDDASGAERLITTATDAMYRAKELGKDGSAVYSREWGREMTGQLLLEAELRQALAAQQFELHYQPIQDADGRLVALEALLRWRHPERGLVGPDQFIPAAERSGMIIAIGGWVLRTACQQLKAWQAAGAERLRVTVNLSARQFRDPKLVDAVTGALEQSGLDPSSLELELTESSIMQQPEQVNATLGKLREKGLRIAIDDFGTGYSSLSYLKRFPIDALKIDRSFVNDLPQDRENAAIVTAIITMSRALNLEVIAEGVETAAQRDYLHEQGCRLFQGYYFHRPKPAAEIAALLGPG